MDQQIEKVVWTYINDRLKPIIADTLNETMPRLLKEHNRDLIPREKVIEDYGISNGKLYNLFKAGILTKYKLDGLTFIDKQELEALVKKESSFEIAPRKTKNTRK